MFKKEEMEGSFEKIQICYYIEIITAFLPHHLLCVVYYNDFIKNPNTYLNKISKHFKPKFTITNLDECSYKLLIVYFCNSYPNYSVN